MSGESFYGWLVGKLTELGYSDGDIEAIVNAHTGHRYDLESFRNFTDAHLKDIPENKNKIQVYRGNLTIYLNDGGILKYSSMCTYDGETVYERNLYYVAPLSKVPTHPQAELLSVETVFDNSSVPSMFH